MENIKVSVITATYNQEKYIAHTLESIVTQKVNFKIEVLVGEDCSTDGTADIVREYASKYPDIIIPFIREKNLGMAGNTMDLTMKAKGDYIAFLEGDDYWVDENKLQKQADFLDAHPDYVACFGHCIIVDENEVRKPEIEQYSGFKKDEGDYTLREFEQFILPGQTASSLYRKIGYEHISQKLCALKDIDPRKLMDRVQILCMMSDGKMHCFGDTFSAYRYVVKPGAGSWSSQNDYYGFDPVMGYLGSLKDMEKIAAVLELDLSFDERRKDEWNKLNRNKDKFSKEEIKTIKKKLLADSNDKKVILNVVKNNRIAKIKRILHINK